MAIKVVGFDADDTLWVNENYFREAEQAFCQLLADCQDEDGVMKELYRIEMKNLPIYGFGIKGFMLSMCETAHFIAKDNLSPHVIERIIHIGQDMLNKPVLLLDQVEAILQKLQPKYRLILVTKGDLLDQQRKLEKSALEKYFHHIEIMSNKHEKDYRKLIKHLDVQPEEFVMIGNSLKSDILPVINVGAQAIYVPYEITWQHEEVTEPVESQTYHQVESLKEVLNYL